MIKARGKPKKKQTNKKKLKMTESRVWGEKKERKERRGRHFYFYA